jgi:hypothetical protein
MANPFKFLGDQITGAITKRIEDNLRKTGEIAQAKAQAYANKKTGAMAAGIHFTVANKTLTLVGTEPYTIFQNSGTRNIPGHFFMERALNEAGKVVWGGSLAISYPNTPSYHRPVYAHKGGYVIPGHLTRRQRKHIATKLLPVSRSLHKGNARRAKLIVGR